ncbi:MAG: hypothetical protein KJP10_01205 [Gammaproteobacteria bacterium]|nr:hypothetical protein [Gammaproteobacteria bacterium]
MPYRSLFTAIIVAVAQAFAVPALYATGVMAGYSADYRAGYSPEVVYKSVDSNGKISYSSRRSADAVSSEKIMLKQSPSADTIDATQQRYEKLSEGAAALAEARLKRQAEREAEERKRLERLALLRSARPQIIEKTIVVGWNPFWRRYPGGHHRHASKKHPSHTAGRPHQRTFHKSGGSW